MMAPRWAHSVWRGAAQAAMGISAWLEAQHEVGMMGQERAEQEGKAINTSLLPLGGSQMKHSCHKDETLSTLTVTQEDVQELLHKASVKNTESPDILHLNSLKNVSVETLSTLKDLSMVLKSFPVIIKSNSILILFPYITI